MKSRYYRSTRYIPKPRNTSYKPDFAGYDREKQNWLAHHPKCTAEEYQSAMREIAERFKI